MFNSKMLLRIGQGDAYAMSCEYIKHPRDDQVLADALKFERYVKHPTHKLDAGSYTDDTQMSIACAEVLLADGPYTRKQFTEAFIRCFLRDPRDGYSRGFQAILDTLHKIPSPYHEFVKLVQPTSTKNGACMRAVPLGVLKDIDQLLATAKIQASVTHNTTEGIWSAQATALMSHFAIYSDQPFNKMGEFLTKHLPTTVTIVDLWPHKIDTITIDVTIWNKYLVDGKPWTERVTNRTYLPGEFYGVALSTVKACYSVLQIKTTLKDILKQVIVWGGDTDSCAAISWGIASSRIEEDLPDFFEGGLESEGKYGADFLKELGQQLMDKYNKI